MKKYILFLIFINMVMGIELFARDLYVSPSGSGSSYTMENPGEIKDALFAAQAGDKIICLDGTYQDTEAGAINAFRTSNSGNSTSGSITITSQNPLGAYFKQRGVGYPAIGMEQRDYIIIDGIKADAISFVGCDYIQVKNCEVINGFVQWATNYPSGDLSLYWGINIQTSNNCLVRNNYVHGMYATNSDTHNTACIMVFGNSDNNIIEYNSVDGSHSNGEPGNVYNAYGTKGGDMDDNIWRYNFGTKCKTGFMAMGSTDGTRYTQRNKVHNNIIINTNQFLEHNHGGIDWQVYNNTFYNGIHFINGMYYADVSDACPRDSYVWNNLIHTATDVYRRDPNTVNWSSFLAYSNYNQVYNCTYYASYAWGKNNISLYVFQSTNNYDMNSLIANPRFINAGGSNPEDYKLTSYPSNGRGGSYAPVIGAYITGNEVIGCTQDKTAPASPIGIDAVIIQ